jgi:hypothetical protein
MTSPYTTIWLFAEGSTLCRVFFVGHSANNSLSSAALDKITLSVTTTLIESSTLGKDLFIECQTLGERCCSAKDRQQSSISYDRYLCRAPDVDTRQRRYFDECQCSRHSAKHTLPSALDTRQSIFPFFSFSNQNFCDLFLHYVELHVLFLV